MKAKNIETGNLYKMFGEQTQDSGTVAQRYLPDFLIGTGGWAYFQVPNKPSLKAYSEIFSFVEVNYTMSIRIFQWLKGGGKQLLMLSLFPFVATKT